MKLKLMTTVMPICLFLISNSALSEDQAWFRLVGFSADGVYAAWEMGGIQDGSGFQWIELEILDTGSSLQVERYRYVWDECVDELPGEADIASIQKTIESLCEDYGIQSDSYDSPLIYHPLTDLSVRGDSVVFCLECYSPRYKSSDILLTLTSVHADIEQNYPDWFPDPVRPVLHVVQEEASHLFFSEELIPEQHRMNFEYSIAAIYKNPALHRSLLVVLHCTRPGFEGPDGRFRVVSGSI